MTSSEPIETRNLVNGQWVDAVSGMTAPVFNPTLDVVLAEVPAGGGADVERAVEAAKDAFRLWRNTTPAERSTMLLALGDAIQSRSPELAELEVLNAGKPSSIVEQEFLLYSADVPRFFAGAGRVMSGIPAAEYTRGYTSMLRREPIGVVGQIVPFNYPVSMSLWKMAPALAAGNTVVLKAPEQDPLSTIKLAAIMREIFPPGVVNILTGAGATVGAAISRHRDVGMVSVTGSVPTGVAVATAGAATLKRTHLELGGKTPVIVHEDADLDALVENLRDTLYYNAGQDCTAPSRLLVHENRYDEVVERVVGIAESVIVGDPGDRATQMGPVISRRQQERIAGLLRTTRGRVASKGTEVSSAGYFIVPTVVEGVEMDDSLIQNEIFGPVTSIEKFRTEEESITRANALPYGLAASVWSQDAGRLLRSARELDFGIVWTNNMFAHATEMPHVGRKMSGHGADLSVFSVEEYTQLKHVMMATGNY